MRSVVLFIDMGDHIRSSSEVIDYDNWQDNDGLLVISTNVFVEIHNSGKQLLQAARTL